MRFTRQRTASFINWYHDSPALTPDCPALAVNKSRVLYIPTTVTLYPLSQLTACVQLAVIKASFIKELVYVYVGVCFHFPCRSQSVRTPLQW